MRRVGLIVVYSFALWVLATTAGADPRPPLEPEAPPQFDWRGLYFGVHTGAGLSLVDVADPFGPSIFGDTVRTSGFLAGGQIGYNWQVGSTVLGLEADASWADMEGTNTCFAYSGFYVSSNCRTRIDALGTFTGRVGWTLPGDDRTLIYGKGGVAWDHVKAAAKGNSASGGMETSANSLRWGWTLGAGVERALNRRWSFKTEYDFLSFGDEDFATPASIFRAPPAAAVTVPGAASQISQDVHLVKIGLNYKIGDGAGSEGADWGDDFLPDLPAPTLSGTELEVGIRYVRGWGRFQKDQERSFSNPNSTQSRLTYSDMSTDGTEVFARLDTSFDLMVKGFLGTGNGSGGQMNDEDWDLHSGTVAYSNTLSEPDYGIRYATIDVGFDWWRSENTKVAPFVGYNYFKQDMKAYGCLQIANPLNDCVNPVPTSVLGLTDVDTWKSLRLGAAIDTALAPRLKVSGDIAYLPYVKNTATNHHLLKDEAAPEWGHGRGVQLEAILSYALTDELSLGVGGRYWSMWTTSGATDKGGILPMRLAAEQAALLLQGSYKFSTESVPLD